MAPWPVTTRRRLRVRVPRCSRSSRKPRTSSSSAFSFVASFFSLYRDRGEAPNASPPVMQAAGALCQRLGAADRCR